MKCKYCDFKYNNTEILKSHEVACQKNPENKGLNEKDLCNKAQAYRFRPERRAEKSGTIRKKSFINLIKKNITVAGKALTVGCSNSEEIDMIRDMGFKKVTGVDLNPSSPGILKIDMHEIGEKIKGKFNFILLSHSLEHAYDYKKVLQGCDSLLSSGGYIAIEIPVNYKVNDVDRVDFEDEKRLVKALHENMSIQEILFAKKYNLGESGNYCATAMVQVIAKGK